MSFSLDQTELLQAVGTFLEAFRPYSILLLGLLIGAGSLHRGLGLIKWAGR